MATIKQDVGTKTSIPFTDSSLSSLANNTFVKSTNDLDFAAVDPLDVLVELSVTVGTTSGNRQVILYAKSSLDGTNYTSGPESGSTATEETNLTFIGALPCNVNNGSYRGIFSVASAFGGFIPPYLRFIVKNETGAALTAGTLDYSIVTGEVA